MAITESAIAAMRTEVTANVFNGKSVLGLDRYIVGYVIPREHGDCVTPPAHKW
jgi:hypothetical protein